MTKQLRQGLQGVLYKDDCPAAFTLKVPDTLTAYLQIANFARRKYNPMVIGITGSSGKTTTKEMVFSVISEKFKTHKTFSNHNNEIGFARQFFLCLKIRKF